MRFRISIVIIITIHTASFAQAAKLYKCVDENGHVTFSQSRCASNADSLNVQVREPTSEELQAAHTRHQQNLQHISDIEKEKQAEAQKIRARAQAASKARLEANNQSNASNNRDNRNQSLETMHKQAQKSFRSQSMRNANDKAFKQFQSNMK
jgi:DNA anti-recombination protein RmuC